VVTVTTGVTALTIVPLSGVNVSGPTTGTVNAAYTFVANVNPLTATPPITYVWRASGIPMSQTHTSDLSDTMTFTWTTPGAQVVTVTAMNAGSTVSGTTVVNIVADSPARITVTPNPITVTVGATQTFTASGADALGHDVPISPTWSTDAGTMIGGNILAAQATPASGLHVTATVGSLNGTAVVNVAVGPLNRLTITPTDVTLTMHATQQFTAAGFDVYNNVITRPSIVWQVTPSDVGVIDSTGWFTAGTKSGLYPNAIVVASDSISTTAKVIVQPYQVFLPVVVR